MGLFRTLGEKVERFKQQADAAAEETYACTDCDATFHAEYKSCPECGGDLEPVEDVDGDEE